MAARGPGLIAGLTTGNLKDTGGVLQLRRPPLPHGLEMMCRVIGDVVARGVTTGACVVPLAFSELHIGAMWLPLPWRRRDAPELLHGYHLHRYHLLEVRHHRTGMAASSVAEVPSLYLDGFGEAGGSTQSVFTSEAEHKPFFILRAYAACCYQRRLRSAIGTWVLLHDEINGALRDAMYYGRTCVVDDTIA